MEPHAPTLVEAVEGIGLATAAVALVSAITLVIYWKCLFKPGRGGLRPLFPGRHRTTGNTIGFTNHTSHSQQDVNAALALSPTAGRRALHKTRQRQTSNKHDVTTTAKKNIHASSSSNNNANIRRKDDGELDVSLHAPTFYELHGPEDRPLVVMIHGFSTPSVVFHQMVPELVRRGYRTLTYDLPGRGRSDSDDVPHNADYMIKQLEHLLVHLDIMGGDTGGGNAEHQQFRLIGYSMGGAIAALFTEKYPDVVSQLVLVAPAGLPTQKPCATYVSRIPIIRDFALRAIGKRQLRSVMDLDLEKAKHLGLPPAKQKAAEAANQKCYDELVHQLEHNHFLIRSLLSTLVHFPLDSCHDTFAELGRLQKQPVLVCWGTADKTCPAHNLPKLRKYMPHLKAKIISNAEHSVLLDYPEEIHAAIVAFFGGHYEETTY